jgi:type IV pilus assembly protein PilQ
VNKYQNSISFLTGVTLLLAATPSSQAVNNQITGVKLNTSSQGIELRLAKSGASAGQEDRPSFFTISRGNTLETHLIDTKLNLPEGTSFRKENPVPGIKAVEVNQLDKRHTQIAIAAEKGIPVGQILQEQEELILRLTPQTTAKSDPAMRVLLNLAQRVLPHRTNLIAQIPTHSEQRSVPQSNPSQTPDVLVPNPEVVIEDTNSNPDNSVQGIEDTNTNPDNFVQGEEPTQPTLPRAVAPAVGDMAVSNINTSPEAIDLGSGAIVPRLVLRQAPVREVLSLLARSAGLNLVFTDTQAQAQGQPPGEGAQAQAQTGEQTISLDLENEPVQEVFNSVLLVSGLNANRKGNTIYVGANLPAQARNLISRTLRLNQVRAENAALFLASQGAEGQRLVTEINEVVDPETGRVVQRTERPATLQNLSGGGEGQNAQGTAPSLLKGLQISTDDRLNSITLVGEPRKVEFATALLTQLDARRRQVAVNVKVIDINLLNQEFFNSSFSFGVNDSFFIQDQGAATLRFGSSSPATSADINSPTGQITNPPAIPNPFAGADTFLDFGSTTPIPGTAPGLIDANTGEVFIPRGALQFFNRVAGVSENPLGAGFTDFTFAEDATISRDADGNLTFERGTDGTATAALPSLFQYPKKFLALLEARITNGNAKVLTDPTLVVQEGQQATVKLAQNIVESIKTEVDPDSGARTTTPVIAEAGLILTVNVERIDDNGFISLSVSPTVSAVGQTQEFDSGAGAVNTLNLLSKREVSSGLIRLRDGQTLILSGIIADQERTTISKVPLLGDIPLLGALFRSSDKANERAEVIVVLTPQIVDEEAEFGYNYNPSKEARQMLQQRGFQLPDTP